jgi:hypothetical protein
VWGECNSACGVDVTGFVQVYAVSDFTVCETMEERGYTASTPPAITSIQMVHESLYHAFLPT